jgi:tetratricopeptide (TPR) repeat protein
MTDTIQAPASRNLQSKLAEALNLLQGGQLFQADAVAFEALKSSPGSAEALHVAGLVRRAQGRNEEALDLYRRSLAINPAQPAAQHNLGVLLRAMGKLDEAIAPLREAVRLKSNYADAHLSLGLVLHDLGRFAEAEKCYRQVLRLQPGYLLAQQSLGAVLNDQEKPKEAETILRRALDVARDPRQIAALELNLGVSMQKQQQHDDALRLFDSAQGRVPDMRTVDYNRANSLQAKGKPEEALESYRRAIQRDPLDTYAHYDLNQLLYRLADDVNFLRSYDEAAALFPEQGLLPMNKASFLLQIGRYEEACEIFARAAPLLEGNVTPLDGQGMALARLGRFDQAIRAHEAALKLEPENAEVMRNLGETLLHAGDSKKALEMLDKSLAIDPQHQGTLAIWSTALDAAKDPRAESVSDYEGLVKVFDLDPPEGFSDIESFNRELDAYLTGLHRDKREFVAQSLRGGTQTLENLFGRGHDLVERLRHRIDETVAAYIAGMREDEAHPLFRRRRKEFGYSGSWSSRLHDCGFHTNHYHSKGWISSAYYVALPETVSDMQGQEGWIKFGEPAFEAGLKFPVRRAIQPKLGRLVLFPSYMWHGTVPFHSQTARTTVAFDAVPR